jgi:hypothetical protein
MRPPRPSFRQAAAALAIVVVVLLATAASPASAVDEQILCEPFVAVADQFAFEVYCWNIS